MKLLLDCWRQAWRVIGDLVVGADAALPLPHAHAHAHANGRGHGAKVSQLGKKLSVHLSNFQLSFFRRVLRSLSTRLHIHGSTALLDTRRGWLSTDNVLSIGCTVLICTHKLTRNNAAARSVAFTGSQLLTTCLKCSVIVT